MSAAVNRAISQIIESDIDLLAADFEAEKAKFVAAPARLEQAHRMFVVLSHSTPDGDDRTVMLSRIEGLGQKIKATLAAPDDSDAQRAAYGAWSTYAARLAGGDSSAQLDS